MICISDEQYMGTALHYYLGRAVGTEVTNDLAMVMGKAGDGYEPEETSPAFFQQLQGGSPDVSLLVTYEDFKAPCEAPSSECAPPPLPPFLNNPEAPRASRRSSWLAPCARRPTCLPPRALADDVPRVLWRPGVLARQWSSVSVQLDMPCTDGVMPSPPGRLPH